MNYSLIYGEIFSFSKSTIKTEKCVHMVKVNNKDTGATSLTFLLTFNILRWLTLNINFEHLFLRFFSLTLNIFLFARLWVLTMYFHKDYLTENHRTVFYFFATIVSVQGDDDFDPSGMDEDDDEATIDEQEQHDQVKFKYFKIFFEH